VIGDDTVSAMQSGIFWGHVALIEGMIARIKAERNEGNDGRRNRRHRIVVPRCIKAIDHFESRPDDSRSCWRYTGVMRQQRIRFAASPGIIVLSQLSPNGLPATCGRQLLSKAPKR